MWVWLFVALALLSMASLIARIFLAVRFPQERRLHVKWAVVSGVAMTIFALFSAPFGRGGWRRRFEFDNRVRGGQDTAMLATVAL